VIRHFLAFRLYDSNVSVILILYFNIVLGLCVLLASGVFNKCLYNAMLNLNSLNLVTQSSRLELRRNSFSVRVIRPWNALPESVVSSPSVKAFESRLDEVWKNQPVRFNYKEKLQL